MHVYIHLCIRTGIVRKVISKQNLSHLCYFMAIKCRFKSKSNDTWDTWDKICYRITFYRPTCAGLSFTVKLYTTNLSTKSLPKAPTQSLYIFQKKSEFSNVVHSPNNALFCVQEENYISFLCVLQRKRHHR